MEPHISHEQVNFCWPLLHVGDSPVLIVLSASLTATGSSGLPRSVTCQTLQAQLESGGSPFFTWSPLMTCQRYEPRKHLDRLVILHTKFCLPHWETRSPTSTVFVFGANFPLTDILACPPPVYASQWSLPNTTQDSVPGCWLGFAGAVISDCWTSCACKAQLPPNRAGGSPAHGPAVDSFLIGIGSLPHGLLSLWKVPSSRNNLDLPNGRMIDHHTYLGTVGNAVNNCVRVSLSQTPASEHSIYWFAISSIKQSFCRTPEARTFFVEISLFSVQNSGSNMVSKNGYNRFLWFMLLGRYILP